MAYLELHNILLCNRLVYRKIKIISLEETEHVIY